MTIEPAFPYRLLIVDDVFSVREALRWAIESVDDMVVVGEASDGLEALRLVDALQPQAVILDVRLPDMDGFEVARQLKRRPDPPAVIFLSVHADLDTRQRGIESGGYAYVEKGHGWQVLIDLLRHALHDRDEAAGTLNGGDSQGLPGDGRPPRS